MTLEVPRVLKDPDLNEFTTSLSIRPQIVGRLMQLGGVSIDEIPDHTIHFSSATGGELTNDGISQYGVFKYETLTTTIYMGSHYKSFVSEFKRWAAATGQWPIGSNSIQRLQKLTELDVNDTVFHETKHAIDFNVLGFDDYMKERLTHNEKQMAKVGCLGDLGMYAGLGVATLGMYEFSSLGTHDQASKPLLLLGSGLGLMTSFRYLFSKYANSPRRRHSDYLASPDEIRAREFAAQQLEAATNHSQLPVRCKFKVPTRQMLCD